LDVGPCDTPNLQTEPVMHIKLAHGVVCLCHGSTLIELPIARLASLTVGWDRRQGEDRHCARSATGSGAEIAGANGHAKRDFGIPGAHVTC
jgi:hypothetical protein